MEQQLYDYGMIGLGTMGLNLLYNMCDHGYSVAGFDSDISKVENLKKSKGDYQIYGAQNIKEFLDVLKKPRAIMLLVPAGHIVDLVIEELKPLISPSDIIMDCGNSHFTDTDRRIEYLAKDNIHFMGVGVSGGESGARYGPSIMPGGSKEAYERVAPMLEAVSAKIKNEPCVTYIGRGSAGHYVKMVHNGIEYGLMQLIAECYQLLKEITGISNEELHVIFSNWNNGPLQSYLIEITSLIFTQKDDLTQNFLIDMILDSAHQKGTGKWMSQNAMDLQVPVPAIDAAVSARDLSAFKNERVSASQKLKGPVTNLFNNKNEFAKIIEQALYFSMITTFSQGISLMRLASIEYKYDLNPEEVVKIWRGGCIIRASLLENIRLVFQQNPELQNLMESGEISEKLNSSQEEVRKVIKIAVDNGIPVPGFMASLSYYDGYRKGWLPSSLLQAQRDFFGAHTYQRIDRKGNFHSQWNQKI